jgi:hypothetical protein
VVQAFPRQPALRNAVIALSFAAIDPCMAAQLNQIPLGHGVV